MPNLLSNRIKRSQLEPADHIYSYRNGHLYSHQGIYMGENRVIHFTRTEEKIEPNSKFSTSSYCSTESCAGSTSKSNSTTSNPNDVSCCKECGFEPNKQRGVVETCVDCFLKGHKLYVCEYGVSKCHKCLKRPGTCNRTSCDPPEKVIERATDMLHSNGFGDYHVSNNNCESFAVYCKTGNRDSSQAKSYMLSVTTRAFCTHFRTFLFLSVTSKLSSSRVIS